MKWKEDISILILSFYIAGFIERLLNPLQKSLLKCKRLLVDSAFNHLKQKVNKIQLDVMQPIENLSSSFKDIKSYKLSENKNK